MSEKNCRSSLADLREELARCDPAYFMYIGLIALGKNQESYRSVIISGPSSKASPDSLLIDVKELGMIEYRPFFDLCTSAPRTFPTGIGRYTFASYPRRLAGETGADCGFFVSVSNEQNEEITSSRYVTIDRVINIGLLLHKHANTLACDGREHSNSKIITPLQQECLYWTARGKTSWETARILGRAEATVNYHIQNSIRRLHAANKTEAVFKASLAGLLGESAMQLGE